MDIPQLHKIFLDSSGVSTDTRKIHPGSLFIAIRGDRFDANTFAAEALNKGAAYVIIDNPEFFIDHRTVLVPDTLDALQQLALYHRRFLKIPIIALTGSNGKTTTKELINVVLNTKFRTRATVGNLNNHIGVPLTLLSFTTDTEIGVVEMGANHQHEIESLCRIAEPDYGYITNFGKAHLEGFGGFEGVIKGKSELYHYLAAHQKTIFVNGDDALQVEKTAGLSTYSFSSLNPNANVYIRDIVCNPFVQIMFDQTRIISNLVGAYNAANISAAVSIGRYFGVADSQIKEAVEKYVPDNNRSQLIHRNGVKILLDAYNANPTSMAAAITNFTTLGDEQKFAILGDMFELGAESAHEHAAIIQMLTQHTDVTCCLIGKEFFANKTTHPHLHFYTDYDSFARAFSPLTSGIVLIKGSRGMALERALDLL